MPIYEYECRGCRHHFEALVRDSSTPACPACQGRDVERMVSLFAVSSESTRQSALKSARRQNAKTRHDQLVAEHEEIHHHDH